VNRINTGGAAIARAFKLSWKSVIFSTSGRIVARRDVPETWCMDGIVHIDALQQILP
jgi:hypothetical protein